MDIDMHYYGVYTIARAAGLLPDAAERIADASQFVDDYTEVEDIETSDGTLISYWPSGHGLVCNANLDPLRIEKADPHKVWVPFHFLPGGGGNMPYQQRMRCDKDTKLSSKALELVLSRDSNSLTPELIGVMAHIYADTYSHYGFSGLRSPLNFVNSQDIVIHVNSTEIREYILGKAQGFFEKLKGIVAASATSNLGHCCVAEYPDRPYLKWEFTYANGGVLSHRDNTVTYLQACEGLFKFFSDFKDRAPQYAEIKGTRDFEDIRKPVKEILEFEGDQEARVQRWEEAAANKKLLFEGAIPSYRNSINGEISAVQNKPFASVRRERVYSFTLAVENIRSMILYELLPQFELLG